MVAYDNACRLSHLEQHRLHPASAQIDEIVAALAVEPMPMLDVVRHIVALGSVTQAVEHEGLGQPVLFKKMEAR